MEEFMEEKAMAFEISSEEENPFSRLPEELIVFIFDKISDAKCLCICTLVSKHFAALVLQARVLFVEVPGGIEACSCHPDPSVIAVPPVLRYTRLLASFIRNTPRFLHRPILSLLSRLIFFLIRVIMTEVRPSAAINFLKKFSCSEFVTIHLSWRNPDGTNGQPRFQPLLRWNFRLSGFVLVSAKNCVALADEYTDSSVQIATILTMEELFAPFVLMRHHFIDSMSRVAQIHDIVTDLPNIKYVATIDPMKQGRVVLGEEEVAIMKEVNPWNGNHKVCLKLWEAPVVKLPLSGCIMEGVSLVLITLTEGYDAFVVENPFEEEEYRELATILVKEDASFERMVPISSILGR